MPKVVSIGCCLLGLLSILSESTFAQYTQATASFTITVSAASVIRLTPSTPITLNMGPTVAGSVSTNTSNSETYLKLTSITSGQGKKVDAQITNGNPPTGTLLKVKAMPCTTGTGTFGTVASQVTLSRTASKTIIQGIGTCYSGVGTQDGYNLIYNWDLDPNTTAQLASNTTTAVFITYTVTLY